MSDEVAMPDVFDYVVSAGYMKRGLMPPPFLLAAADARRRRHPPSGHALRLQPDELLAGGRHADVPMPKLGAGRSSSRYAHVAGRNVGQATTFTAVFFYLFREPTR